jgi:hypothetical protein
MPTVAEKDIYKLDNILIPTAWLLILFWAPTVGLVIEYGVQKSAWIPISFTPIIMLIIGYRVRAKEQKYNGLWRLLDRSHVVSAAQLLHATNFSREELHAGIRAINSTGHAYFIWDQHSDEIMDERFRYARVPQFSCPQCGASLTDGLLRELIEHPACRYCNAAFDQELISQATDQALEPQKTSHAVVPTEYGSKFKTSTFVLLAFFFWPAALVYYFRNK